MTLAEIRAAFPDLFYPQAWYRDEAFMNVQPRPLNPGFVTSSVPPEQVIVPVQAVDLAAAYVKTPDASVWRKFLWTDDVDRWGNPIYVSGLGMYGCDGFQIHRDLNPPAWWIRAA